jgi:hypothetical protein
MATRGSAALGIWMDVQPEAEEDFTRWYRQQHFPERLGVPGFLRGRRWRTAGGPPTYFALYETADGEVLRSPAYLARLNSPTEWTRRVLPTMRNVVRNAYRLACTAGTTDGEALMTLRIEPVAGKEAALRSHCEREVIPALARCAGVAAASLYEAEAVATGVITEERKLVGAMGTAPPFLCLVELRDPQGPGDPALREALPAGRLVQMGLASGTTVDTYTLMYALSWYFA